MCGVDQEIGDGAAFKTSPFTQNAAVSVGRSPRATVSSARARRNEESAFIPSARAAIRRFRLGDIKHEIIAAARAVIVAQRDARDERRFDDAVITRAAETAAGRCSVWSTTPRGLPTRPARGSHAAAAKTDGWSAFCAARYYRAARGTQLEIITCDSGGTHPGHHLTLAGFWIFRDFCFFLFEDSLLLCSACSGDNRRYSNGSASRRNVF